MNNGNGVSRGDRNRNARLGRLRELVPAFANPRMAIVQAPQDYRDEHENAFKVEIQVDAYDRHRLLEDLTRTLSEAGINIVEARCMVNRPMTSNRFVVEVGDTQVLKSTVTRLRNVDGVFDAYRVTPSA